MLKKGFLLPLVILSTFTLAGCGHLSSSNVAYTSATPTFDVVDQKSFDVQVKPMCKEVTTAFNKVAKNPKLTAALSLARKSDEWTPRQASKYVSQLEKRQDLVDGAVDEIIQSLSSVLKSTFLDAIRATKAIPTNYRANFLAQRNQDMVEESLQTCELSDVYTQAKVAYDAYDTRVTAAQDNADSAPWYPSGYTESDTGDVAYKWVHGGYCSIGDYCWHAKFVSQDGCPGGLYAEINILDSDGNVIDWTNATASYLGSSDKAILEFSTFNSQAQTAEMSTVNCH